MSDLKQADIDFYKNGAAEEVLQRFEFTQEEEQLIKDAIRTANLPHPRLKLLQKADALLKEVGKTRKPIQNNTQPSPEVLASIAKINIEQMKQKEQTQKPKNTISIFGFHISKSMFFFILMTIIVLLMQLTQQHHIDNITQSVMIK